MPSVDSTRPAPAPDPAAPVDSLSLPPALRAQFSALQQVLWRTETLIATAGVAGGLASSYLISFVSDRLGDTPGWGRGIILAAGAGVGVVASFRWAGKWWWRRRDTRALSELVQRKFRKLGDRLLGVVELADPARRPAYFSPELYRAAIGQVAGEAEAYRFVDAVDLRPARRWMVGVGALVVLLVVVAALFPGAAANTWARWTAPWRSIPRYTLVVLEGGSAPLIVAHGEDFLVRLDVAYRSFWRPATALGQMGKQERLVGTVREGQLEFRVPGQVRSGEFVVRVGDVRRAVAIRPTHRPTLLRVEAVVEMPAYLQYPVQTQAVEQAVLARLEGSQVSLVAKANRELREASMRQADGAGVPLSVDGADLRTPTIAGVGPVELEWVDTLGLRGAAPWRVAVEAAQDLPPIPELSGLAREQVMLESEVLELKVRARDDYGVRRVAIQWSLPGASAESNAAPRRIFATVIPSPQVLQYEETFGFSPILQQVPKDTVIDVRAVAEDAWPGRKPAESAVYRIHVLGNEKHAENIRLQLEGLLAKLEDVTRLEEKIAEGTRALTEAKEGDLSEAQKGERLEGLREDQEQNAQQLEQMTREGTDALREAMRNPLLSEESLRDWTRNLQQMQELARGQMPQAAQSLQAAQEQAASREERLRDALAKEEEALQSLEEMQSRMSRGLDDMQALTLAHRLRKVGAEEKALETRMQRRIGETIGLLPGELPQPLRRANRLAGEEQGLAQKEALTLQREISRFYERTQRGEYGEVSKSMAGARAGEELERIRQLIEENIGMEAMQQLAGWSDRFVRWAEALEPKPPPSQEGSAGSGEGGDQDEMLERVLKTFLGLLRLRDSEAKLREQTRLLDQRREDEPIYLYNADLLSGKQRSSLGELSSLQKKNVMGLLEPTLQDAGKSMTQVESFLRKPETGAGTRAGQTQTIEHLTDAINLINEQMQQGQKQSGKMKQQSQEMAFLMKMMAQSRGQQPGPESSGADGSGSMAGGEGGSAGAVAAGAAAGKGSEGRAVQKGSGFSGQVPVEFREALESYFKAIEQEGD